jgi:FHS family L-fucose permease-like MFS transporter
VRGGEQADSSMSLSPQTFDSAAGNSQGEPRLFAPGYALPFALVTALFLFWGIPSNMNDILIKQFMKSFEITRFRAGLIQSAYYLGYFLLSMPAALIMRKYSYKTGLVIGLLLYATGTSLFWPAAIVRKYEFFLLALFIVASGAAFLETGANPFIAVLGDPRTSERRLNFSQAFNPLGAVGGVLVGTIFIFSGIELKQPEVMAMKAAGTYDAYLQHETMRVVKPYLVIGTIIFIWALLILRTRFPKIAEGSWISSSIATLSWASSLSSSMSERKWEPGAITSNTCRTTRISPKNTRATC